MSTESFDYVVVGAGSAGCAVANRLSADPAVRVLLLEAGGRDRNIWIHIPVGYYRTVLSPLSWGYATDPDEGIDGRSIVWPRGKVLGGSSSINGLVYIRGQKEDFEHWRQLGNAGWGYDDVLPYFKRAERNARGGDGLHGGDGPVGVSDLLHHHELCEAYIKAAEQVGIPRNDDFNGPEQEGVGYFQLFTWRGRRSSAARAYLVPARGRQNLKVVTDAHVQRITFDGRRATGVAYRQGGVERVAQASGEVVLAAGAIGSPQILQLSGVGPGDLLQEHGVDVVHELPGVGANLQDHYQVRVIYRCTKPITLNDDMRRLDRKALMLWDYLVHKRGPMTVGAGQVGVFARTRPELASPDVQVHFFPLSVQAPGMPLDPFPGFTACVCQLRPESRGTIRIKSRDADQHPSIRANYLSTETDRQTTVDGLKLMRRIARADAMRPYVEEEMGLANGELSDADWLAYARAKGGTIFHPTSTCKMGQDPQAVVDARLRVHGIERLRVADASIMPTVVSGNTNAAAIMIGEKAADLLKA